MANTKHLLIDEHELSSDQRH